LHFQFYESATRNYKTGFLARTPQKISEHFGNKSAQTGVNDYVGIGLAPQGNFPCVSER